MSDLFFGISAKEWSEIIRNYALGAAALLTAYVTFSGLNNWRDQQEWAEKRKTATAALVAIANLRKALILALVNPFSEQQFNLLVAKRLEFEGQVSSTAQVIDKLIEKKTESLKISVEEFEERLVPTTIVFDKNLKDPIQKITSWINVFLADLTLVGLVAKHPILDGEDKLSYIQIYQSNTFSKDQAAEIRNHKIIKLLSDLEERIRPLGGVAP